MEIDFLPIFYRIVQGFCHAIQLWKITPCFYIFSISGEGMGSPPAGAPGVIITPHYQISGSCIWFSFQISFRKIRAWLLENLHL